MTRARELARLANENVLSVEDDSLEVGINSRIIKFKRNTS